MVKEIWTALAAVLLVCSSAGCNRANQEEAVRQGVIDYLAKRSNLNISGMNVDVTSVIFRKDEADAVVSFTAKGANPGQPMSVRYTLERRGNQWVVKNREDAGGNPHGGNMPAQPGAMPPGGALPPGHPSVETPKSKP